MASHSLSQQALPQQCADFMYQTDTVAQDLNIELLEVDIGYSRMTMTIKDNMLNGHGSCHGGYIFTFADTCFAYACNSDNRPTVASGCDINYLRPAKAGDTLFGTGKRVSRGRSTGLYDIEVTNQDGKKIAEFRGRAHQVGEHLIDPANLKETS